MTRSITVFRVSRFPCQPAAFCHETLCSPTLPPYIASSLHRYQHNHILRSRRTFFGILFPITAVRLEVFPIAPYPAERRGVAQARTQVLPPNCSQTTTGTKPSLLHRLQLSRWPLASATRYEACLHLRNAYSDRGVIHTRLNPLQKGPKNLRQPALQSVARRLQNRPPPNPPRTTSRLSLPTPLVLATRTINSFRRLFSI